MTEIQVYDGDGVDRENELVVSDGIILESGVIRVNSAIALFRGDACVLQDDEWVQLEIGTDDVELFECAFVEQRLYLPRRKRNPYVPIVIIGAKPKPDSYEFTRTKKKVTYILRCNRIERWKVPGAQSSPVFSGDEVMLSTQP